MVEQVGNKYAPTVVTPPGETLRDLLEERGIPQAELAARMGRPKKTISEIMNGKAAITPETALQLELVLGVAASFWTVRESNYREYLARQEQNARLARQRRWLERFPLRTMIRLGWIRENKDPAAQVKALLEFFGVASPEQWKALFAGYQVAFRRSSAFKSDDRALAAWLRAGVLQAQSIRCEPYDRILFLDRLAEARHLTVEPPEIFQPQLTDLCAGAGVAVAFIPELPGSRASGATQWLSPSKALIQLSLRYRTDDHLWFTLFHEAAHILFHGKRSIFLEGDRHEGEEEERADRWAADFLIPPDDYAELREWKTYSKRALVNFADGLQIAAGIVVGRLQHDGLLPHSHCNDLKRRLAWATDA
jgi:addiction module HigA family antidote